MSYNKMLTLNYDCICLSYMADNKLLCFKNKCRYYMRERSQSDSFKQIY